jgi:hypothetical protein
MYFHHLRLSDGGPSLKEVKNHCINCCSKCWFGGVCGNDQPQSLFDPTPNIRLLQRETEKVTNSKYLVRK